MYYPSSPVQNFGAQAVNIPVQLPSTKLVNQDDEVPRVSKTSKRNYLHPTNLCKYVLLLYRNMNPAIADLLANDSPRKQTNDKRQKKTTEVFTNHIPTAFLSKCKRKKCQGSFNLWRAVSNMTNKSFNFEFLRVLLGMPHLSLEQLPEKDGHYICCIPLGCPWYLVTGLSHPRFPR